MAPIRCETKTEPCQPNKSMKSWLMRRLGCAGAHGDVAYRQCASKAPNATLLNAHENGGLPRAVKPATENVREWDGPAVLPPRLARPVLPLRSQLATHGRSIQLGSSLTVPLPAANQVSLNTVSRGEKVRETAISCLRYNSQPGGNGGRGNDRKRIQGAHERHSRLLAG